MKAHEERSAVQNPMLKYAGEIGWEYVRPEEALRLRVGDIGLYFTDILEERLLRLNPDALDVGHAGEVIRKLNLLRPTLEGNREALAWLRGEQSVFVPDENRERNVRLIDFDNLDNNVFHVTDEWWQPARSSATARTCSSSSTGFRSPSPGVALRARGC